MGKYYVLCFVVFVLMILGVIKIGEHAMITGLIEVSDHQNEKMTNIISKD